MPLQIVKKETPLRSLILSIDDVVRVVERLAPLVEEEGRREIDQLSETGFMTPQQRAELEHQRNRAFRITVTIDGRDGENLFGYGADPFHSTNIPEPIETIYISNNAAYRNVVGQDPINSFVLMLDFSTPSLIDNNSPLSDPTPNSSHLTVEGNRDAWIASIQRAVMGVLDKRGSKRRFVHMAFVYDIGLLCFGMPASLYLCWRLSGFIQSVFGPHSEFLVAAAYVYVVFLAANIYRVLFGYTKWAFPTVELTSNENRSSLHRKSWLAIICSILGSAFYDLVL